MSIQLSPRRRQAAVLCLAVLGLAACSSAAPTIQAGGGATLSAPPSAPAGGSSAPVGGAGGTDAQYCAAMKVADAQALIKPTIAAAQTGGPLSCAFVLPGEGINGDNMTVNVLPGDGDHGYYNDSVTGPASRTADPIPGVGDVAVWEQPAAGASAPFVAAYKGSLTCIIQPPADTSQLTIDQTGNGPVFQISDVAAAAYAAKEAVLCTDLFALGS